MSKKDDDFLAKVKHQINTTCRPGRVFIGIDLAEHMLGEAKRAFEDELYMKEPKS